MTGLALVLLLAQNAERIEEAKKLLADAGYPGGKGFPKVEILYNTSESHHKIAAVIQNMWKENLGIDVELVNKDWKTYLDETWKLHYQIARRGWIGDFFDPYTFLELMTSRSGNNNTGWSSAEYDKLLERAQRETDRVRRLELLQKAEDLLLEECPIAPIYTYVSQNMWRDDEVTGLHSNLMNIHPMREVVKGDGSGTLVMNNHTEIATLDPAMARGVSEHRVLICLLEGLMNYDPKTLRPVPGVAEKYEVSEDRKTWTFHLRECVWSDGTPVTAADFEKAWKRVLDPSTAADYAHMMYVLKGGEDYNSGKGTADGVGVRAKGDRILEVELTQPVPYFLDLLPFFTFYPYRKDAWNGPFVLKEHKVQEHILLERNSKYWAADRVKQKFVKWLPTENLRTAFTLYEKKLCDYLDMVPSDDEEIRKRKDFHTAPYLGTYYYSFNVTKPPFNDARVRKALSLAIDRAVICEKILKGGQIPATKLVPPGIEGWRSDKVRKIK